MATTFRAECPRCSRGWSEAPQLRRSRSDVSGKGEELSEMAWHRGHPRRETAHFRDHDVENVRT